MIPVWITISGLDYDMMGYPGLWLVTKPFGTLKTISNDTLVRSDLTSIVVLVEVADIALIPQYIWFEVTRLMNRVSLVKVSYQFDHPDKPAQSPTPPSFFTKTVPISIQPYVHQSSAVPDKEAPPQQSPIASEHLNRLANLVLSNLQPVEDSGQSGVKHSPTPVEDSGKNPSFDPPAGPTPMEKAKSPFEEDHSADMSPTSQMSPLNTAKNHIPPKPANFKNPKPNVLLNQEYRRGKGRVRENRETMQHSPACAILALDAPEITTTMGVSEVTTPMPACPTSPPANSPTAYTDEELMNPDKQKGQDATD